MEKYGDGTQDLVTHNILLLLLEAFILSYEGNSRKASALLKQASVRFNKDNELENDFWLLKTYELSELALEIAKVKKQYYRMFNVVAGSQIDDSVLDIFQKLAVLSANKERWMYLYFYFWPRVSMMLGEFVTWLIEQDDTHPKLDQMVEATIVPLDDVIDFLSKNNFSAYLDRLQKHKRILTWYKTNMSK